MTTGVVFVIVLVTKFLDGAYLIVIAIPVLYVLMRAINKHYATVSAETACHGARPAPPSRNHVLVLVSKVSGPTSPRAGVCQVPAPAQVGGHHRYRR